MAVKKKWCVFYALYDYFIDDSLYRWNKNQAWLQRCMYVNQMHKSLKRELCENQHFEWLCCCCCLSWIWHVYLSILNNSHDIVTQYGNFKHALYTHAIGTREEGKKQATDCVPACTRKLNLELVPFIHNQLIKELKNIFKNWEK